MVYNDWILVGVDGSRGSDAAVRYAAREAVRRDLGLRLVHVAPARVQLAPIYPGFELSETGLEAAAQAVLAQSAALALQVVSCGRLRTAIVDGDRADALSAEADRAVLVVLGDQRRSRESTLTSWTCDSVLARSTRPVVLVPADWSTSHDRGPVVAGVRAPDGSQELIRTAVEEAHRRSEPLQLLHAWQPTEASAGHADDVARVRHTIQDAASAVVAEFPDVSVDVEVEEGCPIDVLSSASADADLLILERPAGGGQAARATVRTLLHGRPCPVEFLPSVATPHVPPPRPALTERFALVTP